MSVSRLFGPSCRRRRRALEPVACGILLGRPDSRPLTMTAWLSLLALGALLAQGADLGWLLLPSLLLFLALCMIALFDARYFVIPDGPLLFLVLCGLVTIVANAPEAIGARIAAGALGFVALQLVSLTYQSSARRGWRWRRRRSALRCRRTLARVGRPAELSRLCDAIGAPIGRDQPASGNARKCARTHALRPAFGARPVGRLGRRPN